MLKNSPCPPERTPIILLNRILTIAVNRLGYREMICDVVLAFFLILAWWFPLLGDTFFDAVERFGIRIAEKQSTALVSIFVAAILLPLSLLWMLPVPVPQIHDEFTHLLAADTFAHGRLTNPTHPLWMFFETIHVNSLPTYMSKYPPAQGAVLAIGTWLGHPWFGVLLSIAAMSTAVLWMLQGWVPPRWALLGGVLVMLRVGVSSYWIRGYWGGAIPAIGGALVLGALPRLKKYARANDALLLALGATLLANSRPVEGLMICAPATLVLFWWLCSKRSPALSVTIPRVVLPFCAVMLLCGTFIGYYNWRLTGDATIFPEVLNEKTYAVAPDFIWDKAGPRGHYSNMQFEIFYNGWARTYYENGRITSITRAVKHGGVIVLKFVYFFLWPELCAPLIFLPWLFRDRRMHFLILQFALCFVGWYAIFWFLPHYAGPATAVIFALITQLLRHLRHWKFKGRPVGIGLTRVVVVFALILAPLEQRGGTLQPPSSGTAVIVYRAKFADQLNAMPGNHLAIVRYGPVFGDSGEWVYNAADIDHSKIVWARDIPGTDITPLLDYYKDRDVWLIEPDAKPPRMTQFNPKTKNP